MREWFYSFATTAILVLTSVQFLTVLASYLIIRENVKIFLLKLYPEVKSKAKSPKKKTPIKKRIIESTASDTPSDQYSDESQSSGTFEYTTTTREPVH